MKALITAVLLVTSYIGYSQTGPGGIEGTDGLTNLVLWLRADANVEEAISDEAENNDLVSTWKDQSGFGNDAVSVTSPTFQTNQHNGFPAVHFDGADDNMSLTPTLLPLGTVGRTYIFIAEAVETGVQNLFAHGENTIRRRISITHTATESSTAVGGCKWGDQFASASGLRVNTISYPAGGGSNSFSLFTNAGPLTESYLDGGFYSVNTFSQYAQLGSDITSTSFFEGDVNEVIIFDKVLNSAEFILVHNYLAAKYNLPVAVNDIYDQDDSGNGNYDYDVAGIGRANSSNISDDGQGSGDVRILNPSGLDDNEYLIWGHDNGTSAATETVDIPVGMDARFDRTWRVSEVNSSGSSIDVGSIDVRFDLTGLGAVTASDLRLLIDSDNDGVFSDETAISGATSIGGGVYAFIGVSAVTDNLRFTIGTINNTQTPLPIELINFNARVKDNNTVQLTWQTISEINNKEFTIEKSKDAKIWNEVSTIEGAGNSTELLSYSAIDESIYLGISYYRIKQTDFNGQVLYSHSKTVNIKDELEEVHLSPNPTSNLLTIKANSENLSDLKFFNSLGREVSNLILKISDNGSSITFDLSELPLGVYWVKAKNSVNKVVKQ